MVVFVMYLIDANVQPIMWDLIVNALCALLLCSWTTYLVLIFQISISLHLVFFNWLYWQIRNMSLLLSPSLLTSLKSTTMCFVLISVGDLLFRMYPVTIKLPLLCLGFILNILILVPIDLSHM